MKRLLSGLFGVLLAVGLMGLTGLVGVGPAPAFADALVGSGGGSEVGEIDEPALGEEPAVPWSEASLLWSVSGYGFPALPALSVDGFTREPVAFDERATPLGYADFNEWSEWPKADSNDMFEGSGLSRDDNVAMTFAVGMFVLMMYAAIIATIALVIVKRWDADTR